VENRGGALLPSSVLRSIRKSSAGWGWQENFMCEPLLFAEWDDAVLHFYPALLAQGGPAIFSGGLAQLAGFDVRLDQVGDFICDDEKFIEGDSATAALLIALDATCAFESADIGRRYFQEISHLLADAFGNVVVWLCAMAANAACESLGDAANQGGTDEERVNVNVHQTGYSADAVVGVKG